MNTTQLKIEHYLLQLDRALQGLSVSDRAQIITDTKSRILRIQEQEPSRAVDSILTEIGAAPAVAEPYLTAKGLRPMPRLGPGRWLKWIFVSVAAMVVMVFLSGLGLLWYLSPLIRVDSASGRVALFGGLIDVNEKLGQLRIGDFQVNESMKEATRTSGEQSLVDQGVNVIRIPFNTAKLDVTSDSGTSVRWDCKSVGGAAPQPLIRAGVMTLNLDTLNVAKCSITLPRGLASEFHGINGKMELEAPSGATDISLTNGKVNVRTDTARVYDFEVKVKNGLQDFFPRSADKTAVKVRINVINGLVKKE